MFLDHAEDVARGKTPMTMADWDSTLNEFLQFRRREILQGAGQVSHDQMERKALREYAAYHARQLKLPEVEETAELPEIAGEGVGARFRASTQCSTDGVACCVKGAKINNKD